MQPYLRKIEMPGGQWITVTVQATHYEMAKTIVRGMYPAGKLISATSVF